MEHKSIQCCMPRMPPMVPVSYPNSTPPKATNNPTMMAGAAEPGTSAGFVILKGIMTTLNPDEEKWKVRDGQ